MASLGMALTLVRVPGELPSRQLVSVSDRAVSFSSRLVLIAGRSENGKNGSGAKGRS